MSRTQGELWVPLTRSTGCFEPLDLLERARLLAELSLVRERTPVREPALPHRVAVGLCGIFHEPCHGEELREVVLGRRFPAHPRDERVEVSHLLIRLGARPPEGPPSGVAFGGSDLVESGSAPAGWFSPGPHASGMDEIPSHRSREEIVVRRPRSTRLPPPVGSGLGLLGPARSYGTLLFRGNCCWRRRVGSGVVFKGPLSSVDSSTGPGRQAIQVPPVQDEDLPPRPGSLTRLASGAATGGSRRFKHQVTPDRLASRPLLHRIGERTQKTPAPGCLHPCECSVHLVRQRVLQTNMHCLAGSPLWAPAGTHPPGTRRVAGRLHQARPRLTWLNAACRACRTDFQVRPASQKEWDALVQYPPGC